MFNNNYEFVSLQLYKILLMNFEIMLLVVYVFKMTMSD